MKSALFFLKKESYVQCVLCPHNCRIKENQTGICGVRKNIKGKLYALSYSKPCSLAVDPIEKKPLFHFMPGTKTFSIATAGCNLKCKFCQNAEISQAKVDEIPFIEASPSLIVEKAISAGCKSIAYTYTEPTVFYEYCLDTAKLAKKEGLSNVFITNGLINKEPLKKISRYIDAANIDLKGFSEDFYQKVCGGKLKWVLDSIKNYAEFGIHIELTNMIIPGLNDNSDEIREMCRWIVKNCGKKTPLHFSRFFPCYKMLEVSPTPLNSLLKAYDTAKEEGLYYVYIGNVHAKNLENTICPKCGTTVIEREGFEISRINRKCPQCRRKVDAIF